MSENLISNHKKLKIMKTVISILSLLFVSLSSFAYELNPLICRIYFTDNNNGHTYPEIKRAPQRNPGGTYYDTVNVSFGSDLSDVSITVSRDGAEIYSDDYPNIICGEVITYSLDEAGEYTTTVYVDGERIAEETVNISE